MTMDYTKRVQGSMSLSRNHKSTQLITRAQEVVKVPSAL